MIYEKPIDKKQTSISKIKYTNT